MYKYKCYFPNQYLLLKTFTDNVFTSAGTKTYSFVDGDCTESEAAYLLAISEKVRSATLQICCLI